LQDGFKEIKSKLRLYKDKLYKLQSIGCKACHTQSRILRIFISPYKW